MIQNWTSRQQRNWSSFMKRPCLSVGLNLVQAVSRQLLLRGKYILVFHLTFKL